MVISDAHCTASESAPQTFISFQHKEHSDSDWEPKAWAYLQYQLFTEEYKLGMVNRIVFPFKKLL